MAPGISPEQAQAQAVRFDSPTGGPCPETPPAGSLYGAGASDPGRVITFPGGIPLAAGDDIVGAVGASGTVDQDQAVAEAAVGGFHG